MTKFFETRMGYTFYAHTMPAIARELKRLNDLLEKMIDSRQTEQSNDGPDDKDEDR